MWIKSIFKNSHVVLSVYLFNSLNFVSSKFGTEIYHSEPLSESFAAVKDDENWLREYRSNWGNRVYALFTHSKTFIKTWLLDYILIKYGLRIYKVGILNYSETNLWKKMFKAIKSK